MAVIFRDARNLVISEYRMRTSVFDEHHRNHVTGQLEPFIKSRFEVGLEPPFSVKFLVSFYQRRSARCPPLAFVR